MINIKLNKLFVVISIFSIHLIPFAKKFSFETAPVLLILFCITVVLSGSINIKKIVEYNKEIILLIIFLLLVHLSKIGDQHVNTIALFQYLIGPLIFLFFFDIKKFLGINELLLFGYSIFFLHLVFFFKPPIIFSISCNTLEFFVARLDCANSINLSKPFLITPEPSYLTLMLSFYLIILNYFKQNITDNKKLISILIVEILTCILIYQTGSRIGSIFLTIFIIFYVYNYKLYKNFFFIFLILTIIVFLNLDNKTFIKTNLKLSKESLVEGRSILNLDKILIYGSKEQPLIEEYNCGYNKCLKKFGVGEIINQFDPTGAVRLFHNLISFKASYNNNFLPHGFGAYEALWYHHTIEFNLTHLTYGNEVMSKWHQGNIYKKKQKVQNYFFSILHDGGVIPSLLILICILKSLKKVIMNKNKFGYIVLFYVILSFFFQSTITSPYPWLALGFIMFDNKKKYAK